MPHDIFKLKIQVESNKTFGRKGIDVRFREPGVEHFALDLKGTRNANSKNEMPVSVPSRMALDLDTWLLMESRISPCQFLLDSSDHFTEQAKKDGRYPAEIWFASFQVTSNSRGTIGQAWILAFPTVYCGLVPVLTPNAFQQIRNRKIVL